MDGVKLPREIYYVQTPWHGRPYAKAAHVKAALRTHWRGSRKGISIYRLDVEGVPGWQDVTDEFLDENGQPTW
ncbi:hypothetical protein GCM10010149_88810 [Nonomuraea roseoviolacea subsp. roseoviolacea]|uniref:hypothetical protein n=1 Tax=Nonomuraea roseoviolacea TaxID=103837 RepID=UPI0031E0A77F